MSSSSTPVGSEGGGVGGENGTGSEQQPVPVNEQLWELRQSIEELPASPGVYLYKDVDQNLLYIGKSVNLRQRVRSYFRSLPALAGGSVAFKDLTNFEPASSLGRRQSYMVRSIRHLEVMVTSSAHEALLLESALIRQRLPPFNVLLKDDRQYPYICITWSRTYPEIYITRQKASRRTPIASSPHITLPPRDRYLGPFSDSNQLRSTLDLIKEVFPMRQRPKPLFPDKPCLNYDIGRCPGVCQGLISPEAYRETMEQVQMVFEGRTEQLVERLETKMKAAAELEAFERAAELQTQIGRIQRHGLLGTSLHFDFRSGNVDCDVWALAAFPNDVMPASLASSHDQEPDHCPTPRLACVQMFQVRGGRIVNRMGWSSSFDGGGSVDGDEHAPASAGVGGPMSQEEVTQLCGEVMEAQMDAYYGGCTFKEDIPPKILTSLSFSGATECVDTINDYRRDLPSLRDVSAAFRLDEDPKGEIGPKAASAATANTAAPLGSDSTLETSAPASTPPTTVQLTHPTRERDGDELFHLTELVVRNARNEALRLGARADSVEKALTGLMDALDLPTRPTRIEG